MENTNWKAMIRGLKMYHKNLKMVNDLYDKYSRGENVVLTDDQKRTLYKIYLDSWYKKKIDREMFAEQERQETMSYTTQMNAKFKETQQVESSIGFKHPSTLTPSANRYKLDTSPEARVKRFDELFGEI